MDAPRNASLLAAELLGRPLSTRSVIASLLLGRRPPRAPVALLVRWGALFGISEGATRVALSRMVAGGELQADGGSYELRGRVRGRQAEHELALSGPGPWDGSWVLHVVRSGTRTATERAALRDAAGRARLGELREGVWARPDNLGDRAPGEAERRELARQTDRFSARPDRDDRLLADRLFGAIAWSHRCAEVRERLEEAVDGIETDPVDPDHLVAGFLVGASAMQHLRRDPVLPEELCPGGAPGRLRQAYRRYQAPFDAAVGAWWASVAGDAGPPGDGDRPLRRR